MHSKLIAIAQQIRAEQLQGDEAFKVLHGLSEVADSKTSELIHFLYHYATDADIRKKDPEYGKWQASRLDALLNALGL